MGDNLLPIRAREREQESEGKVITSIDKNTEGAWRLSAFIGGRGQEYLLTRTYYFYTKAEAIKQFKQEIKGKRARA